MNVDQRSLIASSNKAIRVIIVRNQLCGESQVGYKASERNRKNINGSLPSVSLTDQ